jgi:hypothetical protein
MKYQIENGIHDIPNDVYHQSSGISRSALWEFRRAPIHYWYKYLNPMRIPQESSPQMKLGEYVHALVLEPKYFSERYIVKPAAIELPKVGLLKDIGREEFDRQKAARESFKVANELMIEEFNKDSIGKEIVSPTLYAEAKLIADAVLSQDIAKALFTDVSVEQSIYFTHKPTGLQCKVRPDAWSGSIVTDLKTCADASFDAFRAAAARSGYFLQAAMIKQALESIGITLEKFIFYCVEKSPSLPCTYYTLNGDSEELERGENDFNTLMHGLAHCMETDNWGSYEPRTLTYPNWAREVL